MFLLKTHTTYTSKGVYGDLVAPFTTITNTYHINCFLETPEERIKLLRAGFANKRIEELYVKRNNFKMVHAPEFNSWFGLEFCPVSFDINDISGFNSLASLYSANGGFGINSL